MSSIVIVTGAAGLIGSEASRFFIEQGYQVIGIDNDMRAYFFGKQASTKQNLSKLSEKPEFTSVDIDIRDQCEVDSIFRKYHNDIKVVIHTAAQPSHDWAASEPHVDFSVNATGTLNLLEATRLNCPEACFIFTSTNKVYGDRPNQLPLVEHETRWEIRPDHRFSEFGIDESMSIDQTTHSLFGCSKTAADLLVQEYGRYFGMKTVAFRGGCLTGPGHSGAQLHGFLSYLTKCAVSKTPYTIIGYKGKQVRDNIHATDLIRMFWEFVQQPRIGEVYNAGGGRFSNCSVLEAIQVCEELTGNSMQISFDDEARRGDHVWYISDTRKFQNHYPNWKLSYNLSSILKELIDAHTQTASPQ